MKPNKITAVRYNNMVKLFNDAANDPYLNQVRDQIISMRKGFPTYAEIEAAGIKFVDRPTFIDENGDEQIVKTWMGSFANPENDLVGDILECEYVYCIGFVRGANPQSMKPIIGLKIRGIPKGEFK